MTKIILDVKKSNIDQLNNNEIVFNIDKLWSNDDKGLLYKQNAKDFSQNKNTTKKLSHLCIENSLFGDDMDIYIKDNEVLTILNKLFQITTLPPSSHENLGSKEINNVLWKRFVDTNLNCQFVMEYLTKYKKLVPYAFYQRINLLELLVTDVEKNVNKQTEELLIEDFLIDKVIKKYFSPTILKKERTILKEFYNHITPDYEIPDYDVIQKKSTTVKHDLVHLYLCYLKRKGNKKTTLGYRMTDFKRFFNWMTVNFVEFNSYSVNDLPLYLIKEKHLKEYKIYLLRLVKEEKLTALSAKYHLRSIKKFFQFLYQNKRLTKDITRQITNITANDYFYRELPKVEDIQQLFRTIQIYSDDVIKEKLALSFMLFLGLRISEVVSIKWDQVNIEKRTISILGKNDKCDLFPLPDRIYDLFMQIKRETRYVFSDRIHGFKEKLYQNFKLYFILSDWNYEASFHLFRHCYITELTNYCKPQLLQALARHSDFQATSRYIHFSDSKLLDDVNKIF